MKDLKPLKKQIRIELAEWRLADAKEEANQWGHGYMRGLEVALEWIEAHERKPEPVADREENTESKPVD